MDNLKLELQAKVNEIQDEARTNPKITEEIAGLERYISETYISRVFYELIQNADDCQSNKFVAKKIESDLYFLNDGNIFSCDDLEAICRSAFSTKQRGKNIGYRGIGFKSTSGIAEDIAIYSGDLEIFFSKKKTKELFNSNSDVPLLRVPHWGSINDTVATRADELIEKHGCNTCFVLTNVKEEQLLEDMKGLKSNAILFLNFITNITIQFSEDFHTKVYRHQKKSSQSQADISYQDFDISFKSILGKKEFNEQKVSRVWEYKKISVSSDLENGIPIRLPKNQAYAQAFLPMLTVTGLGAIINGDFSTDPSRTRIATDDQTKSILGDLIELLNKLLQLHSKQLLTPEDYHLLEIIIPFHKADVLDISPSFIASTIKQSSKDEGFEFSSFLIRPAWMTKKDYEKYCCAIGKKSLCFDQLSSQDSYTFFKSMGASEISVLRPLFLLGWLQDNQFSLQSTMDLVTYINEDIRLLRTLEALENSELDCVNLIPCENGDIRSAKEINNDPSLEIDVFSFEATAANCGGLGAIDWYILLGIDPKKLPIKQLNKYQSEMAKKGSQKYRALLQLTQQEDEPRDARNSLDKKEKVEHIIVSSKLSSIQDVITSSSTTMAQPDWRKAEIFAIDILKLFGIEAKDVSKRNIGCDLIGIDKTKTGGHEIYIEVKLLTSIGEEFRITDNEIYVAKERGSLFWILLLVQPDKQQPPTHFSVIKNAYNLIEKAIDRRCVKYESFCSEYTADFGRITYK